MDQNKLVRVQVDLHKKRVELIDAMLATTGTRTRREYIDQAVLLLAWAISAKKEGRTIGAIDTEHASYQGILLPILADSSPTVSHEEKKQSSAGKTAPNTTAATALRLAATR